MKKGLLSTVVLLVIAASVAGFLYKRYRVPPTIDLPAIALTNLEGQPVSLRAYAGKPLFINFFATWCGPCLMELPELAALKVKLADKQVQLICISDEPVERLLPIQAGLGNGLVVLHSNTKFHDMGVYTYPTNYIFNAACKKVYEKVNPDDWLSDATINKIRQLLD